MAHKSVIAQLYTGGREAGGRGGGNANTHTYAMPDETIHNMCTRNNFTLIVPKSLDI